MAFSILSIGSHCSSTPTPAALPASHKRALAVDLFVISLLNGGGLFFLFTQVGVIHSLQIGYIPPIAMLGVAGVGITATAGLYYTQPHKKTSSSTLPKPTSSLVPNSFLDEVQRFRATPKGDTILWMSISAHPIHYGHLFALESAVLEAQRLGYTVTEVRIAIPSDVYVQSKAKGGAYLNFNERKELILSLLEETKESRPEGWPQGLTIQFFDDQHDASGQPIANFVDHPATHQRLIQENPTKNVIFVGGADLAYKMRLEWEQTIPLAIVVYRPGDDITYTIPEESGVIQALHQRKEIFPASYKIDKLRCFITNHNQSSQAYSSTAIREKKNGSVHMMPGPTYEQFLQLWKAAQEKKRDRTA